MFFFKKLFPLVVSPFFFSCSLDYMKSENSESSTPEFVFNNSFFTRYETGKIKTKLKAEKIEQYKSDNSTFAKAAEFESYNSEGNLETSGSCSLLEARTDSDIYRLFDDIYLHMIDQKMEIQGTRLFFNKKTEQITSSMDNEITLKKDDFVISGTGFSASGVSKSFAFENTVSGTIITKDENNEEENLQENQ